MHSILITNHQGRLLLSRYFDESFHALGRRIGKGENGERTGGVGGSVGGLGFVGDVMRDREQAMRLSECEVLGQTRHLWMSGTGDCPQVARAKGGLIIVFGAVEGLLLFLCGTGEYDELTLSDMLRTLSLVVVALCREAKASVSEEALLVGSTYSKVCLALDEMLPGGVLESLDAETILAMTKMRTPSTATGAGI
ncbi:unnamed protein product [Discosporangium mesarthrocarpum]